MVGCGNGPRHRGRVDSNFHQCDVMSFGQPLRWRRRRGADIDFGSIYCNINYYFEPCRSDSRDFLFGHHGGQRWIRHLYMVQFESAANWIVLEFCGRTFRYSGPARSIQFSSSGDR